LQLCTRDGELETYGKLQASQVRPSGGRQSARGRPARGDPRRRFSDQAAAGDSGRSYGAAGVVTLTSPDDLPSACPISGASHGFGYDEGARGFSTAFRLSALMFLLSARSPGVSRRPMDGTTAPFLTPQAAMLFTVLFTFLPFVHSYSLVIAIRAFWVGLDFRTFLISTHTHSRSRFATFPFDIFLSHLAL